MFRNKNIANSFWNMTDIFLYPILFFLSTSFFIRHLGQSQFGIWMLINTVLVSMQILNFGIGSSVFKNTALYIGTQNESGKIKMLNNSISITILLFVICASIGLIGYYLMNHRNLLGASPNDRQLCAKCFIVAGLLVGIKFFEQIFTYYFKALEKFRTAALLGSGNRICGLFFSLFLLFFFKADILSVLLVFLVINLLFIVLGFVSMIRSLHIYHFKFNLKIPKSEFSFALFTWLQSLAIILTFQSDRYLVVSYFGLFALSYYALAATIFNQLHMGFSAILPWLSPKFTKLYAQNKSSDELFSVAQNVVISCSLILLLVLYQLYPFIFKIILGAQTANEIGEYTKYFIVFEAFFIISIVPTYYFNAVGHERVYLYYVFFFCSLCLISMFISVHFFHTTISVLYGMIVACAISMFILKMILLKIISGAYQTLSCAVQLLPSVLVTIFIFSNNLFIKSFCLVLFAIRLYSTLIRGHRAKLLILVNS